MMDSLLGSFASRLRILHLHRIVVTKTFVLMTLGCIWVLMIFVVDPRGNFPLNDDWSYSLSVKTLLEEGRLHVIDWIAATAVAQIFWGALFCLPSGFSFIALRISGLVLGLIGVLATYGLLREIKTPLPVAFLGAAIVATNPIYFELSNTFMTDVPFFSTTMLSFLMFIRGMRRKRQLDILAGALIASIAILIRQMGIVISLSFAIAYLFLNGVKPRNWLPAAYPALLGTFTLLMYELTHRFSNNYGHLDLQTALHIPFDSILKILAANGFIALMYISLFLLPFLLLWLPLVRNKLSLYDRQLSLMAFVGFYVVSFGLLILRDRSMPLLQEDGNILMKSGLGPAPLRDSFLELHSLPNIPEPIWWIVTAASVLGASLLFTILVLTVSKISRWRTKVNSVNFEFSLAENSLFRQSLIVFLGSACLLYFAPMSITGFYDRYLIPMIPLLMSLVVLVKSSRSPMHLWQVLASACLLFIYAVFTLSATHDYLSWNRARWDALRYLTGPEMQISSRNIDGGYEFNGWYNYNPQYRASPEKSSWWDENDNYIVVFTPIPGYRVIKHFPFENWLPFGEGRIFVMRRTELAP